MEKPIKLSTVLIALPAINILMASVYLVGYCSGFGAHLAGYLTVDDLFTTSINNLWPLYLSLAFLGSMELRRYVASKTMPAAAPEDPIELRRMPRWYMIVGVSLSTAVLLLGWVGYLLGHMVDVVLLSAPILPITLMFILDRAAREIDPATEARPRYDGPNRWVIDMAWGLALLVGITFVLAFNGGQEDRHGSFEFQSGQHAMCGEVIVLRRLGGGYLGVGKDDRHRVLDEDCSVRLVIPAIEARIKGEALPAWLRWLVVPIEG